MKRFLAIALAASLGLVLAGSASAANTGNGTYSTTTYAAGSYNAGDAANGIGNSRHNLGAFSDHVTTMATTEICVFCHTPHHTNQSMGPIWNRGISSSGLKAYGEDANNWNGGKTVGGSTVGPIQAPSLACLSCHDGVTTFDNLVNAPGKGMGTGIDGAAASQGWDMLDHHPRRSIGTNASLTSDGDAGWRRLNIGGENNSGNPLTDAFNPNSGLSDDHPVGVDYSDGDASTDGVLRASLRPRATTISSIDLRYDLLNTSGAAAGVWDGLAAGSNLWAVSGFISDTATIGDLLRNGKVECASCHDPHFNNKSWTEVESTWGSQNGSNGLFLRRVGGNSGSGVCRTCHQK